MHKNYISKIINENKLLSFCLMCLTLLCSIAETLGLGMLMPLMELIVDSSPSTDGWLQHFTPIISQLFPEKYLMVSLCGIIALFFLLKNILIVVNSGYTSYFVYRLRKHWQALVMKKYMYSKYSYFYYQKQGVLLNNLVIEPARGAKALQLLVEYLSKIILSISLYALMLIANWKITLVITFLGGLLFLLINKLTQSYSNKVGERKIQLSQDITDMGSESVSAIRQVKTFSIYTKIYDGFQLLLDDLLFLMVKFTVIKNLPKPIIESIFVIGVAITIICIQLFEGHSIADNFPLIILFAVVCQRFIPLLSYLISQRMTMLTFLPSLKLVHQLCETQIEVEDLDSGEKIDSIQSDIVLKQIDFAYNDESALFSRLNLTIPKGKITAIVGPSGSGKSTLVDILFGFQKIENGTILINNKNFDDISLDSWRKIIGYVSQDTFLFNNTIRENILIGKPDASDEELYEAVNNANAAAFIEDLPKGLDTIVGDRGIVLSGGQRQRIAIARAIIRNPQLFIFDEATSSLDTVSERHIQKAIDDLGARRKKTIIIISHRLTTVKNADIIYVIDNGKVIERDSFENLMKKRGNFYRMNIT